MNLSKMIQTETVKTRKEIALLKMKLNALLLLQRTYKTVPEQEQVKFNKKRRPMSAEARAKIASAQRRRWVKYHKQHPVLVMGKRKTA